MRIVILALLFGITTQLSGQEKQPDFTLDGFDLLVRKVTPELLEALEKQDKKPRRVAIAKECDQSSFEEVCKWDWVQKLTLNVSLIREVSPISGMSGLKAVRLEQSGEQEDQVPVDLAAFGKIAGLEYLVCHNVAVTNPQGLAGLSKLKQVRFEVCNIDSLEFLKRTPAVESVNLYGFGHTFASYEPLLELKNLKYLDIYYNKQATDDRLAVLKGLTSLEVISMSNSLQVTTLDFLENCRGMKRIDANWAAKLTDISALETMMELEHLQFDGVPLTNISSLKGKPKLKSLDLGYSKVVDVNALSDATSLSHLILNDSDVSDLTGLKGKDKLEYLILANSQVTDLSPLAGLKSLSRIDLSETAVTNFLVLETCPKLRSIKLPHTATAKQATALQEKFPKASIQVSPKPK